MSRVRRTAKGRVGQEVAEGSRSDQEALGKVGRVLDATGQYIESEQSGKKTTILPALIQVIEYGWQLGFSSVLNIYRWMAYLAPETLRRPDCTTHNIPSSLQ